jgi:biotin--protein ligase|tara:strand:+ start:796 stop:2052 length:1257 start_codon:yes stop_codon:yes gene_type:complete
MAAMSTDEACSETQATRLVQVWTKHETGGRLRDGSRAWEASLAATPEIKLVRGEVEDASQVRSDDGNDGKNKNASAFRASAFFDALTTSTEAHVLYTARELQSTQSMLQENLSNLNPKGSSSAENETLETLERGSRFPPGALVLADCQIGGRGRGGNVWTSPPGCLLFSFSTTHTVGATLPFLQYVATMAAVDAIQEGADAAIAAAAAEYSQQDLSSLEKNKGNLGDKFRRGTGGAVDVRIKWPNDLYSGGAKIGGVLCTSTFVDGQFDVVIGVGINLDNETPTTCVNEIIAKRWEELLREANGSGSESTENTYITPEPTYREHLTASFMNRFEALAGLLNASDSFASLEPSYLRQWLHTEQSVVLEEPGGNVQVTVKGLTKSGYLLANDSSGQRFELHPDGNSFDFFKGLVRKKLAN